MSPWSPQSPPRPLCCAETRNNQRDQTLTMLSFRFQKMHPPVVRSFLPGPVCN